MSSTPGPVMELLGRIAYEFHQTKPLIPTYIHLLASAVFPIYTAAHASLARPSSAAPSNKKTDKDTDAAELQDEEISPTIETLTPSDAILFPILAGATLASLYFILKWLQDPALLNYYLGLYFAVVGLYFNVQFVGDALATIRSIVLPSQYSFRGKLWRLKSGEERFIAAGQVATPETRTSPLPAAFSVFFRKYNSAIWSFRKLAYTKLRLKLSLWNFVSLTTPVDILDLVGLIVAIPVVYYHTFIDKPWILTNLLGFSFCYGSLQITTPGTLNTGFLLLCALFLYDIYFVFFTPMMVTVATKLDVPIKLLFPRPDGCIIPVGAEEGSQAMEEYLQCIAKKRTMAMLGLGDIVIPGMMLAFALRFDLYLYYQRLAGTKIGISDERTMAVQKVPYLPATGMWGERLWTSTKLYSPALQAKQFPKTYFTASVVGYVLGMVVTVLVMQITQHAQPALLYLVPGVLISLMGTAAVRRDFGALWVYSEMPEDEKKEPDRNGKQENIQDEDKKSKDHKEPATKKQDVPSERPEHLVLFSLSVIIEHKPTEPGRPPAAEASIQEGKMIPDSGESDTDQFSIDSDNSGDASAISSVSEDVVTRSQRPKTSAQGSGVEIRGGGGQGIEPAMKRRRKL